MGGADRSADGWYGMGGTDGWSGRWYGRVVRMVRTGVRMGGTGWVVQPGGLDRWYGRVVRMGGADRGAAGWYGMGGTGLVARRTWQCCTCACDPITEIRRLVSPGSHCCGMLTLHPDSSCQQ